MSGVVPGASPGYESELLIPLGMEPDFPAEAPVPADTIQTADPAPEAPPANVPSRNEILFSEIASMNAAPLGAVPVLRDGAAPLGAVPVSRDGAAPLGAVPSSGHGAAPVDTAGPTGAVTASLYAPSMLPPAGAPGPGAPRDFFHLRAAQKVLSPTLEDGFNDAAVFGADAAEVVIVGADGRRVFQGRRAETRDGVIRWNCRNPAGKIVDSGTYFAQIFTEDGRSTHQSFIVVR